MERDFRMRLIVCLTCKWNPWCSLLLLGKHYKLFSWVVCNDSQCWHYCILYHCRLTPYLCKLWIGLLHIARCITEDSEWASELLIMFNTTGQIISTDLQWFNASRGESKVYFVCPPNCIHCVTVFCGNTCPFFHRFITGDLTCTLCFPKKTFLQGKHTALPAVSINQLLKNTKNWFNVISPRVLHLVCALLDHSWGSDLCFNYLS